MTEHRGPIVEFVENYAWITGPSEVWTERKNGRVLIHCYQFRELVHKDKLSERIKEIQADPSIMGYPDVGPELPKMYY